MRESPVLLATNTFGLLDGEINGVAYTCRNVVRMFRQARMAIDVLTYGRPERIEVDGSVRLLVHDPKNGLNIDPALRIDPFISLGRIRREAAATRYSLVHSTTPDPLGWLAADIAEQQRVPFVAGYHTALDAYARVRLGEVAETLMTALLQWYYDRADMILVPSIAVQRTLRPRFNAPIDILGRGINTDVFSPLHRTRAEDDGEVRAIYVGRIAQEKGLDRLPRIFDGSVPAALTIVGDGPYAAQLRRLCPAARFTGMLSGQRLSEEFANADLFVFPSETDSFGNVLLQAMASGVPAIVTDVLGPKEVVIHGVTGFVTNGINEFRDACRRLAADRALRSRMSLSARRHAARFQWQAVFEKLLEHYESVGWNRVNLRRAA